MLARIVELGRDIFDEEDLDFQAETPFREIKEWDSLNHMRMVVAMEEAFSIRFDMAELQSLTRVSDLLNIIEKHRATSAR